MKLLSLAPLIFLLAACGGGVDLSTPDKAATAYLNAMIAGDREAVQNTLSRETPPAIDMAEGTDFPKGEASGYQSFRLLTQTPDSVDAEITFKDGSKANRRLYVVKEGDNYRISNYVWIP